MTLLMCVWRLSEREAGHNIYPLWEDETLQSQQSANNIHPPLVPFQKALSVSELHGKLQQAQLDLEHTSETTL